MSADERTKTPEIWQYTPVTLYHFQSHCLFKSGVTDTKRNDKISVGYNFYRILVEINKSSSNICLGIVSTARFTCLRQPLHRVYVVGVVSYSSTSEASK